MRHKEVASVMTPAERVITVELGSHYKDIAKLLHDHRISAVPVVDSDSHVLGIISEADILTRGTRVEETRPAVLPGTGERHPGTGGDATALEVMTAPALTVRPDEDVVRAARLMLDRRVKRLVVTDEQDHLLGMVSRQDLLEYFARSDSDIHADITQDTLLSTLGIAPDKLDVTVDDGVVHLNGRVATRNLTEIVSLVISRVDGVVDVVNKLDYDRDDTTTWP
jgi:CBS domain-containing protein